MFVGMLLKWWSCFEFQSAACCKTLSFFQHPKTFHPSYFARDLVALLFFNLFVVALKHVSLTFMLMFVWLY